jgi:phosphomannomutase
MSVQIKFGTDGWRAIIAHEFTTDNVARVAQATALRIIETQSNPLVVIGHDCRFGGELFAETTAKVMSNKGIKVLLAKGITSTPMVSLGCFKHNATFGVVITASHNPASYNGYKLKSYFGGPSSPDEIDAVERLIPLSVDIPIISMEELVQTNKVEYIDLETLYFEHVEKNFDMHTIRNCGKVFAYDAMYGAGQNIVKRLMPEVVSLHCEQNPTFNGTAPEPLHKNLLEFSELIANSTDIDFGFANDGDADRVGAYDSKGRYIDSHHVILLLIHYLHIYKKFTGKVVIAFSVSDKVKKLCKAYNIPYVVTKIGFKYICDIMVHEDVLLGGEESGGIAIKGHIPERDGVWNAITLIEFMARTGKSIEELIEEVYAVVGAFDYNRYDLHITEPLKRSIIEKCKTNAYQSFGKYPIIRVEDVDGWKFYLDEESWVMVRASGTEPVLRVYCESENMERVLDMLDNAKATLLSE